MYHRNNDKQFLATLFITALLMFAFVLPASAFYDEFDDSTFSEENWIFSTSTGTITQDSSMVHLYVPKPSSGCEDAWLRRQPFSGTHITAEARILFDGYGVTGINMGYGLNFLSYAFDSDDYPYLHVLNAQDDNTNRVRTSLDDSATYRGTWHTLKIVKTNDQYDLYLDDTLKGSVANPDIGDTDLLFTIGAHTCSNKSGAADTYYDWASITTVPPNISVQDSVVPVDDLSVQFGSFETGTTSNPETIRVFNDAEQTLTVSDVQLTGTDASDFILDTSALDSCTNSSKVTAEGEPCTIQVSFSPLSAGAKTAIIQITSDDPDNATVEVELTGTAIPGSLNSPPSAPELFYPHNGSMNVNGNMVTLKWRPSVDPDGDPVSYLVYLSPDPEFLNSASIRTAPDHGPAYAGLGFGTLILGAVFSAGLSRKRRLLALMLVGLVVMGMLLASCGASGFGSGGSDDPPQEASYTITGLADGTTYYWKVVADDGNGGRSESETWTFTTQ